MEYTVAELAGIAGVSSRTLRYYDEIGLLTPTRSQANGYRRYGQREVDILQHILFYRELGLPLESIRGILSAEDFDRVTTLEEHLSALRNKRERLDELIDTVERSLSEQKGESKMTDKEKFKGFLQELVDENEKRFGKEARARYGNETVDRSNAKLKSMTETEYSSLEELTEELHETLKAAYEQGDPSGDLAQKACELHKEWLCHYWDEYSKEAHIGVSQMYVNDPRFSAYYDAIAPGCAVFLRDAIEVYCA